MNLFSHTFKPSFCFLEYNMHSKLHSAYYMLKYTVDVINFYVITLLLVQYHLLSIVRFFFGMPRFSNLLDNSFTLNTGFLLNFIFIYDHVFFSRTCGRKTMFRKMTVRFQSKIFPCHSFRYMIFRYFTPDS